MQDIDCRVVPLTLYCDIKFLPKALFFRENVRLKLRNWHANKHQAAVLSFRSEAILIQDWQVDRRQV